MHDFATDLLKSKQTDTAAWWERVYRQAFPDFLSLEYVDQDGADQRNGTDVFVYLTGGKRLRVDQKVRDKDYPDFFLEEWSSLEHHKPGWVSKTQQSDYIAYAFLPSHTCYLLPFQQLRTAWLRNKERWQKEYGVKGSANRGYTTVGVPVPITVVMRAITAAMFAEW